MQGSFDELEGFSFFFFLLKHYDLQNPFNVGDILIRSWDFKLKKKVKLLKGYELFFMHSLDIVHIVSIVCDTQDHYNISKFATTIFVDFFNHKGKEENNDNTRMKHFGPSGSLGI